MQLINLSIDKSKINSYLSNSLLTKIKETLEKWEKVILYLNKRWQFNSLICNDCQNLIKCKNCDISMSVHKYPAKLICHLCSYTDEIPIKCNKCNWNNLAKIWVWTQQIEESLKYFYKNKHIFRFDTDTMKTKKSKTDALEVLNNSDIIIWTKMITTWFNFNKVWLIWIILIEQELQIPKYNTEESVYTNIKQLIWRWWRVWQKTDFLIQSFIPDNEIIQSILFSNYKEFFIKTLEERKLFSYPPFWEIATIEFRAKSEEKSLDFMWKLKNKLDIELENNKIEVIFNKTTMKKFNQFYSKIVLKGENLRNTLEIIKPEIIRNSGLSITFD